MLEPCEEVLRCEWVELLRVCCAREILLDVSGESWGRIGEGAMLPFAPNILREILRPTAVF